MQQKYETIANKVENRIDEEFQPTLETFQQLDDPGEYLAQLNLQRISARLDAILRDIAEQFAVDYNEFIEGEIREHWAVGDPKIGETEIDELEARFLSCFDDFRDESEHHEKVRRNLLYQIERNPEGYGEIFSNFKPLAQIGVGAYFNAPAAIVAGAFGTAFSIMDILGSGDDSDPNVRALSTEFRASTVQTIEAYESGSNNFEDILRESFEEYYVETYERAAGRQAAVESVESFASSAKASFAEISESTQTKFQAFSRILDALAESAQSAGETGASLVDKASNGGNAVADRVSGAAENLSNWWSGESATEPDRLLTNSEDEQQSTTQEGWRTWYFGPDLRLQPVEATDPEGSRRHDFISEEALETLLLLNLDVLFPRWSLDPEELRIRDWGGPDIRAIDPAGRRHIFELKHDAPSRDVIDQITAYGLTSLRSGPIDLFREQPLKSQLLANRLAAFWSGERLEIFQKGEAKLLAPQQKWSAILKKLIDKNDAEFTPSFAKTMADSHIERFEERYSEPPSVSSTADIADVHLHMAVPYATSISDEALAALDRMTDRHVAVNIWETAIDVDPETFEGTLWLRPAPVESAQKPSADERWRAGISELFAEMARLSSPSTLETLEWEWNPEKDQIIAKAWPETPWTQAPRLIICLCEEDGRRIAKCSVTQSWPKWIRKHPNKEKRKEWRELLHKRRQFSADWLLAVLDEFPNESADKPFTYNSSADWETTTSRTGIEVEAHHSSSDLKTCEIKVDLEENGLSTVALCCNEARRAFKHLAEGGPSPEFGPIGRE